MLMWITRWPWLRGWYRERLGPWWVRRKIAPFVGQLKPRASVLDIGAGNGLVAEALIEAGHRVTLLDVQAGAVLHPALEAVVYDGHVIPYADKSYDYALLLTVLHHIETPEAVLLEAARVADRVVIIEDIYRHRVQQYATYAMDWWVNFGYAPAPHTNKSDKGWRATFEAMGLQLEYTVQWRVLGVFRQVVYVVNTHQLKHI